MSGDYNGLRVAGVLLKQSAGKIGRVFGQFEQARQVQDLHALALAGNDPFRPQPAQNAIGVHRGKAGQLAQHLLGQGEGHAVGAGIDLGTLFEAVIEISDGVRYPLFRGFAPETEHIGFTDGEVARLDVRDLARDIGMLVDHGVQVGLAETTHGDVTDSQGAVPL